MFQRELIKYMDNIRFFDIYGIVRSKITNSQTIILNYHRIGPMTDKWINNPLHQKIFGEQMKYLSENYEIISLNDLSEMIIRGNIPKKAVVITFDDGYKDNYEFAFPVLKKYNIPATIFLATGPIEQRKIFWWDKVNYALYHTDVESIDLMDIGTYQLISDEDKIKSGFDIVEKLKRIRNDKKESIIKDLIDLTHVNIPDKLGKQHILSWNEIKKMDKNGIDFGAHTVNHPILTNVTLDEAKWEINSSKNFIEEILERKINSFAYPNGKNDDFNTNILSLVKNSGFNCSVSFLPGLVKNSADELYKLNRSSGEFDDFKSLKSNLCGLSGDKLKFLGILRNLRQLNPY